MIVIDNPAHERRSRNIDLNKSTRRPRPIKFCAVLGRKRRPNDKCPSAQLKPVGRLIGPSARVVILFDWVNFRLGRAALKCPKAERAAHKVLHRRRHYMGPGPESTLFYPTKVNTFWALAGKHLNKCAFGRLEIANFKQDNLNICRHSRKRFSSSVAKFVRPEEIHLKQILKRLSP